MGGARTATDRAGWLTPVVLLALLLAPATHTGASPWSPPSAWLHEPAFDQVRQAKLVDLDGDGDLDVLGASAGTWPAWWENLAGDGSDWLLHELPISSPGAAAIEADDLDGDGDIDIALLSLIPPDEVDLSWDDDDSVWVNPEREHAAVVWLERTGGGWQTHELQTQVLEWATDLAIGDLDGDGDPDLAITSVNRDVQWLENTGYDTGWPLHDVPSASNSLSELGVADLDGDGDADLVLSGRGLRWLANDGTGTSWESHQVEAWSSTTLSVEAVDLDGDSDEDLVGVRILCGEDELDCWHTLVWWKNDGDPELVVDVLAGDFMGWSAAGVGDLDGDGDLDLAVPGLYWLERDAGSWVEHESPCLLDLTDLGDLDGDGDVDALGSPGHDPLEHHGLAWCASPGEPGAWPRSPITPELELEALPPIDVDGDGDLDLPARSDSGVLAWLEALGQLEFAPGELGSLPDGDPHVVFVDLDGDGLTDALASAAGDGLLLWRNDGDGWTEVGPDEAEPIHAVADLDGDGDADLLGTSAWYENDGSPWSLPWTSRATPWPSNLSAIDAIDLDGDGDVDAVLRFLNHVSWWSNDGDGDGWTDEELVGSLLSLTSASTADLDGDGALDVVASGTGATSLVWWRNEGGWSETAISAPPLNCHAAADLDGDGDVDLAGASAGDLLWWRNHDGAGTAWLPLVVATPETPVTSLHATDLDGDGHVDLVASLVDRGAVALWTVTGCGDADGDGFATSYACALPGGDCYDDKATIHPAAEEVCDGVEQDCDPATPEGGEVDADGDGHPVCDDCDDHEPYVHPGAPELCDGRDNDCDPDTWAFGGEEDGDADGSPACEDCDDDNPGAFPGAPELCDGFDSDCSPYTEADGGEQDHDGDGVPACADPDDGDPCVPEATDASCQPADDDDDDDSGVEPPPPGCGCDAAGPDAGGLLPLALLPALLLRRR